VYQLIILDIVLNLTATLKVDISCLFKHEVLETYFNTSVLCFIIFDLSFVAELSACRHAYKHGG
jgi:hypothetical protein